MGAQSTGGGEGGGGGAQRQPGGPSASVSVASPEDRRPFSRDNDRGPRCRHRAPRLRASQRTGLSASPRPHMPGLRGHGGEVGGGGDRGPRPAETWRSLASWAAGRCLSERWPQPHHHLPALSSLWPWRVRGREGGRLRTPGCGPNTSHGKHCCGSCCLPHLAPSVTHPQPPPSLLAPSAKHSAFLQACCRPEGRSSPGLAHSPSLQGLPCPAWNDLSRQPPNPGPRRRASPDAGPSPNGLVGPVLGGHAGPALRGQLRSPGAEHAAACWAGDQAPHEGRVAAGRRGAGTARSAHGHRTHFGGRWATSNGRGFGDLQRQWPVGSMESAAGNRASPALRASPPLTSPTALTTGCNPAPLLSGSGVQRESPTSARPGGGCLLSAKVRPGRATQCCDRQGARVWGPSSSLPPNLSHRGGSSTPRLRGYVGDGGVAAAQAAHAARLRPTQPTKDTPCPLLRCQGR